MVEQELHANYVRWDPTLAPERRTTPSQAFSLLLAGLGLAGVAIGVGAATLIFLKTLRT
jgi:hypothetical protein